MPVAFSGPEARRFQRPIMAPQPLPRAMAPQRSALSTSEVGKQSHDL